MSYLSGQRVCASHASLRWALGFWLLTGPAVWAHVSLVSPNGGEQLTGGEVFPVQWHIDIAHVTQNWDLWFSTESADGPWEILAEDLTFADNSTGLTHSFNWSVPNLDTDSAWVRVQQDNLEEDYLDVSNAPFVIAAMLQGADFTGDGMVGGGDLDVWEQGFGIAAGASVGQGDADLDADVDGADFLAWQAEIEDSATSLALVSVPEPEATLLLALGMGMLLLWHR